MTALAIDKDKPAPKIHNKKGTVDYIGFSHEISVKWTHFSLVSGWGDKYNRRLLSLTFSAIYYWNLCNFFLHDQF